MKEVFAFSILVFVLLSCKKDKFEPGGMYYQLPEDGIAFIQLPVNSYYIFQDSATAIEDSVVVVTSTLDKIYVPAVQGGLFNSSPAYYYQVYSLKLKAVNSLPNEYWFSGSASTTDISGIFSLYTNYNSTQYPVFTYPTNGRFIDSIEVEGNTFTNIEKFEFGYISNSPAENISGVYYWAKGIGIIKRQITIAGLTKTASLVRHG